MLVSFFFTELNLMHLVYPVHSIIHSIFCGDLLWDQERFQGGMTLVLSLQGQRRFQYTEKKRGKSG